MLTFHKADNLTPVAVETDAPSLPPGIVWVDALSPTPQENAFLRRALGVEAPSLDRMQEIESSSRLYRSREALFATVPLTRPDGPGLYMTTPIAFVVTPAALLTVKYQKMRSGSLDRLGGLHADREIGGPFDALITILEAIVDEIADELEGVTAELDRHSHAIFTDELTERERKKTGAGRRETLIKLGKSRDFTSQIGETLLNLARMSTFLVGEAAHGLPAELRPRFERLDRDIASLSGHEGRLSEKIQFLLDASLGLIGVEQNDVFKVLTMVSVVGIPPTLLASMYGMNFKNMPEYDWPWGYQYGLTVIALSALIPLVWFKWRQWW